MGAITDFFGDTLQTYVSARYNAPQTSVLQGYPPGGGFSLPTQPVLGVPFVDIIPEPPAAQCGGAPVYKKVCGSYKWVFPKRRRRKQLLTNGDAAGLAKLKGIVGVGKTMESWIATHS